MKISLEKNEKWIIVKYPFPMKTITSSFYSGGVKNLNGFFIVSVNKDFNDAEPERIMKKFSLENKLKNFAGFMTAVDLEKHAVFYEDQNFFVLQTLGLGHNCVPGEDCKKGRTINTAVVYKKNLSMIGAMDMLQLIIGSRTYTLCREKKIAGTSTDSFLLSFIFDKNGPKYSGYATETGKNLAMIIKDVTESNISKFESGIY